MELNKKRHLNETSPDKQTVNTPKRNQHGLIRPSILGSITNTSSMASSLDQSFWNTFEEKLNSALENKLKSVAKKEDLITIKNDVTELRNENTALKAELGTVQKRLEQFDKNYKRANIVVRGLVSSNNSAAVTEFTDVCLKILHQTVCVCDAFRLPSGDFVFKLPSAFDVANLMSARKALKGSEIFFNRDLTADEKNKKYNLRMLAKKIPSCDTVKVRAGDFALFVNDKKFIWSNDTIVTSTKEDADMINNILNTCDVDYRCQVVSSRVTNTKAPKVVNSRVTNKKAQNSQQQTISTEIVN